MSRKSLSIVFINLVLLCNTVALGKDFYITIPFTISNINSVKEKKASENFNLVHESALSPSLGVGLGYYINDNSRIELLFEKLNFSFNNQIGNFQLFENGIYTIGTKTVNRKVFGTSLKFNHYHDILQTNSFQVFIGGGIGYTLIKEHKSLLTSGHYIDAGNLRSFPSITENKNSPKTTNFTYSLMVGASKNFNSIGHFDLTYSWKDHGRIKNNNISNKYRGHHFSLGVRFDL